MYRNKQKKETYKLIESLSFFLLLPPYSLESLIVPYIFYKTAA